MSNVIHLSYIRICIDELLVYNHDEWAVHVL